MGFKTADRRADWLVPAGGALLVAGTIAVYCRTFSVPLLLDDLTPIADNPSIRHLWPLWPVLSPPAASGVGGRPLVNLSYALNYAAGGTAVAGYHAVNLAIHILAALTLFGIVRRTLAISKGLSSWHGLPARGFSSRAGSPCHDYLALAVSSIWAWHPLQTESVTYISERAESLMGLFYLLTLYSFIRFSEKSAGSSFAPRGGASADEDAGQWRWGCLSVGACVFGMATKEVMVTAPLAVFLYDRTFVSGSFGGAWRTHWRFYAALAATWIPLGCLMAGLHSRGVGFGQGVTGWAYGLTECRVIVKYLALAFWPRPLVFDYGAYTAVSLHLVWPAVVAMAALLIGTLAALSRSPKLGFLAAWFFLILAPTSSIVPILGEPMAENRMYLPLAGVVTGVVLGAYALAGRWSFPVLGLIATSLALASAQRNEDYRTAESIWSDTVAKSPGNARAHNNLGNVWLKMPGRLNEAIAEYQQALKWDPWNAEAHNNLGNAWVNLPGKWDDAVASYEEAVRLRPNYAEAENDLGSALLKVPGRLDDAIDAIRQAIRLRPDYAEAYNNLGDALLEKPGGVEEAIAAYEEALRLKPDYAEAHYNLANVWSAIPGRLDEAVAHYGQAVRLDPGFAEAHFNLGNAWMRTPGRMADAVTEYEAALRVRPDYAEAEFNLAVALLNLPGRTAEAEVHLEAFLKLRPDSARGRQILAAIRKPAP